LKAIISVKLTSFTIISISSDSNDYLSLRFDFCSDFTPRIYGDERRDEFLRL
jgi:hypothetical protein